MLCDNQFCLATMTLYFSAVWTQSGESGNTLKIKCSVTADERANIFPCLQRRRRSEQQPKFGERHNALRLQNKPSSKWSVKRLPTTLAHSTDSYILSINIFILNYCNLQVNVTQYPMMINRTSVNIVLNGIHNTNCSLKPLLIIKIFRNFVV